MQLFHQCKYTLSRTPDAGMNSVRIFFIRKFHLSSDLITPSQTWKLGLTDFPDSTNYRLSVIVPIEYNDTFPTFHLQLELSVFLQ